MVDVLSPKDRSALMSRIKGKDSKPELLVRKMAHNLGFRYRLHRRDLPGTPDLVFAGRRKVIFVHGCFWHHHAGCKHATIPKTRHDFWVRKLQKNVERDRSALQELSDHGWNCLVIWECETKCADHLSKRISEFLQDGQE